MTTRNKKNVVPRKKLTFQEKEDRRKKMEVKKFQTNIKYIFLNSGFTYIQSEYKEIKLNIVGFSAIEFDAIFVYENIIVIVEDTSNKKTKNHLPNKIIKFESILDLDNKEVLIESFINKFDDFAHYVSDHQEYDKKHYIIRVAYFSMQNVSEHLKEQAISKNIKIIEKPLANYFYFLVKNIMESAKYELLKFFDIQFSKLGKNILSGGNEESKATYNGFLLPSENSSYPDGYKIVSFYIDPESLLKKSFVLRKNSWIDPDISYQRILDAKKIKQMRKYLATDKRVYLSNIIATLPPETKILDIESSNQLDEASQNYVKPIKIIIPDEYNVIGIIDGQHRVYSYHESTEKDAIEQAIRKLRLKQNLLVTGIIYPENQSEYERLRYEAKLFLEINTKQTKVKSVLTQEIELIVYPYSSTAIAKAILIKLAKKGALKDKLEEHTFDDSKKLKVSSIVSYGIKPLISKEGIESLFTIWPEKDRKDQIIQQSSKEALDMFIDFCVMEINFLLNAIKAVSGKNWQIDDEKRMLTPTAINGFLKCLRLIVKNGDARNIEIYKQKLQGITEFDFIKYKSSHWSQLGIDIYNQYFNNTTVN